jgi:hypothetical protein
MKVSRRSAFVIAFTAALVVPAAAASAASNPSGSGQPSASCEESASSPAGFASGGFLYAETQYAGSQPQNSNNPKSVSQYDVACFQVSQP